MSARAIFSMYFFISLTTVGSSTNYSLCQRAEITTTFLGTALEFIQNAEKSVLSGLRDNKFSCCLRPLDCEEMLHCGYNRSGVYTIWPKSRIIRGGIKVFCDMDTHRGGWTVIQRRGDYGREKDFFYKSWESYKNGFGDVEEDFWLGNDLIFALTNQKEYSIRFDLRDVEGERRFAVYDDFWIEDEKQLYRLHIKDYKGNAGNAMKSVHDNRTFTTKDRDADENPDYNCAERYKGAWWYGSCHHVNLNGLYLKGKHETFADGINWYQWKGHHESMDATEMKIRSKDFHHTSFFKHACNVAS